MVGWFDALPRLGFTMNFDNWRLFLITLQNDPRFVTAVEFGRFADDICMTVVPGLMSLWT